MEINRYLEESEQNLYEDNIEKEYKNLQKKFRKVFSTEDGKIVLTAILEDLHYFQKTRDAEAEALNNYAKTLLFDRLNIGGNSLLVTEKLLTVNMEK